MKNCRNKKVAVADAIEVISFDRLVNTAKERNQAFFDKLGLPMS
jgi:hypothetical protein